MSLFSGPEEHAANLPETWVAVRSTHSYQPWRLETKDGGVLQSGLATKRATEALKSEGFYVNLYEKESRWYAGESVAGWRPYADVTAEREAPDAKWATA